MKLGPVGLRRPRTWKTPGSPAPRASQGMSQPSWPQEPRKRRMRGTRGRGGAGGADKGSRERAARSSLLQNPAQTAPNPPPNSLRHRRTDKPGQPSSLNSRSQGQRRGSQSHCSLQGDSGRDHGLGCEGGLQGCWARGEAKGFNIKEAQFTFPPGFNKLAQPGHGGQQCPPQVSMLDGGT